MLIPLHALEDVRGLGALLHAQSVSPNVSMSHNLPNYPYCGSEIDP
ncbi:hypothetical protein Krac_9462 [Ktedonobacter racemifer DSM 44963]|uniref:Uncharacterized protein n=1 Tax=Ktedonobacter racemifer DSM 44963 TaxID=485913 RepID=D6TC42_KTERA|nr:hypothetical protein Krac_9462 [Ktedonobacter racemifer DSM 44963]